MSVRHRLEEGDIFFLLVTVAMLLFLYVVKVKVGTVTAIKGMYSLCGLLFAAGVYFRYSIDGTTLRKTTGQRQTTGIKSMMVLASLSLTTTALTGDKLLGLLVLLPLGYGLLAWQIVNGVPTNRLLAQTLVLFSLPPVFEYLTSGFYFGYGDIFKHVLWVENLMSTSQLSSIFSSYQLFPGLHLLIGSVSTITGLPPYETFILVGILSYAEAILVVYLLAYVLFDTRLPPILVAIAATMLSTISFYATYFYPESLAVVLILNILLISLCVSVYPGYRRLSAIALILGCAVVITHHLTIALFVPILVLYVVGLKLLPYTPLTDDESVRAGTPLKPRFILIAIVGLASVFYWITLKIFIPSFVAYLLLFWGQYNSLASGKVVYRFGVVDRPESAWAALTSLGSPTGVYNIVLIGLFILGLVVYLDRRRQFGSAVASILLVGIVGSVFQLATPLNGMGLERIGLPLSFFFAFVIGLGLTAVAAASRRAASLKALFIVIMVVLGTLGPVLSGHDVYRLEKNRVPQKELSREELAQLQTVSLFGGRYATDVTTDWVTSNAMLRHGRKNVEQPTLTERGLKKSRGLLLYRKRWIDHEVLISTPMSQYQFVLSRQWMNRAVQRESKVYTSGMVGATWSDDKETWSGAFKNGTR
jgi:hypothetical protein